jgi:outer membrane protein assembly factor BamB
MYKKILLFGIISLFFVSTFTPITFGYTVGIIEQMDNVELEEISNPRESNQPIDGSMDSAWPMYCHDTRHTGRSPYNTASNLGHEKWFFDVGNFVYGSAAIDNNNVIYFGSWDCNFYAVYLTNHSLKWKYKIGGIVISSGPAIDENGIVYVGTSYAEGDRLFAFYPDGTVKWTYFTGENIESSPVIGDDGTIYFGNNMQDPWHGYINALYPNGTLKWRFRTGHLISSDPAIGLDGTIYCGSHDGNMYALYPNGTLKWKYKTGDWVARGVCIGDDSTVYFGSWDSHLYAVYPNGTLKWKTKIYGSTSTNPIIGEDGTIYIGYQYISAVYPDNGSIKWTFDNVPGRVLASNLCISADGIIYFGTQDGGYLVALNPDGTERWRRFIGCCYFAPIIGDDGSVYVGSSRDEWKGGGYVSAGFLHAFGELHPNAPFEPEINGPTNGNAKTRYDYNLKAISPVGKDVYFYIDWGDQVFSGWQGPYASGEEAVLGHSWRESGAYSIIVRVKDTDNLWGPWEILDVTIPRDKVTNNMLLLRILERLPLLEKLVLSVYGY